MIFQGKSKKPKKGKMYKVDNRILGFSVTAAPDRINVGDRDYGEGVWIKSDNSNYITEIVQRLAQHMVCYLFIVNAK